MELHQDCGRAVLVVVAIALAGTVGRPTPADAAIPAQAVSARPPDAISGARATDAWPRVLIPDPGTANILRRGLEEASRLLADARCQTLLTEFRTGPGRSLAETLRDQRVDLQGYLRLIHFRDGSQHPLCSRAIAYTTTGGRVVYVCGYSMERHWRENRNHVAFALIHEVLHTLGLEENPPSTAEINDRVRARCWAALLKARQPVASR
jgi:hypothetical protein